jgi:tellurite resistance protein TerC
MDVTCAANKPADVQKLRRVGKNGGRRRGVFLCAGVVNTVIARSAERKPGAGGRQVIACRGGVPAEETSDSRTLPRGVQDTGRCSRAGAVMSRVCRRFLLNVSTWVWTATLVALFAMLAVDLLIVGRRPHEPSMREAGTWVAFYVGLALIFGAGVWATAGGTYAGEFYTGWLTEYSLSVDNLFVFVIIMGRFAVPREYQQKVLLIGIVLALIMRGAFIAAGAALIEQFSWVFYIFGAFLVYTAISLARQGEPEEGDFKENALIRWSRRALPISSSFDSGRMTVISETGKRMFTPMLIVMIAIGTTDLIFALDSIPAIFGITKEPYLVFTANVFALMGLRQLYFLLGGLLERLIYLNYGLAFVLGFIGVKLVLEALHTNQLPFLNGGEGYSWAPEIPIWLSLVVIIGALGIATVASLVKSSRDRRVELSATHR